MSSKWTISEKYNASQNVDYKRTIVEICSFTTVEEFAYIMKKTIYSKVTDLLSEPSKCKMYKLVNLDSNNSMMKILMHRLKRFNFSKMISSLGGRMMQTKMEVRSNLIFRYSSWIFIIHFIMIFYWKS